MSRDLDAQDAFVKKLVRETAELEAEVKELREERRSFDAVWDQAWAAGHKRAEVRIKQMEEALRGIAEMEAEPVKPDGRNCIDVARAALSPSDTEEEA